jgi:hypothetical protein
MDPYLERPGLWEEIHTALMVGIQQYLTPLVQPRYRVAIERRVYMAVLTTETGELVGKPDVMLIAGRQLREASVAYRPGPAGTGPIVVQLPAPEEFVERYLEIRDVTSDEVITVLELLSPGNKLSTQGRRQYEEKRAAILGSRTNLVEIDLLRAGQPFPINPQPDDRDRLKRAAYRVVVSRAGQRPLGEAYLFSIRDRIPAIPIPLRDGEPEPELPLNDLVHDVYQRGRYDLAINYSQPAPPPFSNEDAAWIGSLLEQATRS